MESWFCTDAHEVGIATVAVLLYNLAVFQLSDEVERQTPLICTVMKRNNSIAYTIVGTLNAACVIAIRLPLSVSSHSASYTVRFVSREVPSCVTDVRIEPSTRTSRSSFVKSGRKITKELSECFFIVGSLEYHFRKSSVNIIISEALSTASAFFLITLM